ncbi:unnamed protein product [Closterium sp. Naga37s-1]|nr:unnamed protein product [Closterium sp. Naga37s-1]
MLLRPSSIRLSYLTQFALCCARTTHSLARTRAFHCLLALAPSSSSSRRSHGRHQGTLPRCVTAGDCQRKCFPLPTPLCQHTYRAAAAEGMEEQWEQRGERERRVLPSAYTPLPAHLQGGSSRRLGGAVGAAWRAGEASGGMTHAWAGPADHCARPTSRQHQRDRPWPSLCLHPSASTPTGRQQQKAWRSSGSSVASGRGEWWDDARPGLALLTTALAQPPGSTSATDRGVSEWRCGSRGSVAARREPRHAWATCVPALPTPAAARRSVPALPTPAAAEASGSWGTVEGRGSGAKKGVGAEVGRVGGEQRRGAEEGSREGEKTWVEEEASRGWQADEGAWR